MSYRPRQYEDDILPYEDEDYALRDEYWEVDPDQARDLQMEREWAEEALLDEYDHDPRPDALWDRKGGYVDEYMVRTYGRGPGG